MVQGSLAEMLNVLSVHLVFNLQARGCLGSCVTAMRDRKVCGQIGVCVPLWSDPINGEKLSIPYRDRPRRRFSPTRFISRGRCLWFLWAS